MSLTGLFCKLHGKIFLLFKEQNCLWEPHEAEDPFKRNKRVGKNSLKNDWKYICSQNSLLDPLNGSAGKSVPPIVIT